MSTSSIALQYLGSAVNPLTPRKYTILNGEFVYIFHILICAKPFRNISLAQNKTCLYIIYS